MQVNILLDFTEITMHVLQGQVASRKKKKKGGGGEKKSLSFFLLVRTTASSSTPCDLVMEMYSSFQADMQYRAGHISLLIRQQPLIIMGAREGEEKKKNLAYSQCH